MSLILFVTKPTDITDDQRRMDHAPRLNGLITSEPEIGDQVIDQLQIFESEDGSFVAYSRIHGPLKLTATANWGDQYEPGAEIRLANECLRLAMHGGESLITLGSGYSLATNPLYPLVYDPESQSQE